MQCHLASSCSCSFGQFEVVVTIAVVSSVSSGLSRQNSDNDLSNYIEVGHIMNLECDLSHSTATGLCERSYHLEAMNSAWSGPQSATISIDRGKRFCPVVGAVSVMTALTIAGPTAQERFARVSIACLVLLCRCHRPHV